MPMFIRARTYPCAGPTHVYTEKLQIQMRSGHASQREVHELWGDRSRHSPRDVGVPFQGHIIIIGDGKRSANGAHGTNERWHKKS